jgi:iron complex outermembrane receptor protein
MMRKSIFLSSIAISVLLQANPALAQHAGARAPQTTTPDASDTFPDAIVVTARRRAEDMSKVPIAISAFSGEQLIKRGIQNTLDLVKVTLGLNIQGGGGRTNAFVVIRGQSKAVTGNGSPGVITYMNDVPMPNNGSLIQSYDMDNIQVLKGPQGTLFGRNSIGGAVLTVTKAPSYEWGGYAMADVAQYDNYIVEGAINVPIVNDHVALRLAAQVGHNEGNIKTFLYSPYTISNPSPGVFTATPGNLVPSKHDSEEYALQSYRASLLIEPTDWIRNVTVGDYSKIRGQAGFVSGTFTGGIYSLSPATIQAFLTAGSTDPSRIFFANTYANTIIPALAQCSRLGINDPRCDITAAVAATRNGLKDRVSYVTADPWIPRVIIKGITNTTTVQLGENHQLKNIFAIRTTDGYANSTLTGLAVPVITTGASTLLKQTTDELQLSGSFFGDDLKYTAGGFLYKDRPNGRGGYQALEVNTFFGLSHNLSTTFLRNDSQAVYGQVDYSLDRLVDGLTFTAGARQTWDQQSACTTNYTVNPFGPALLFTGPGSTAIPTEAECKAGSGTNIATASDLPKAKFKKLTFTFGANWQISPSTMVYVTRRRGYRAGAYNTPQFDPFLANIQTFAPEVLDDWEAGTKLRFNSGGVRGSLDLAVFTGKDKANQLPVGTSGLAGGICIPQALGTPGHTVSNCSRNGTPGSLVAIPAATTIVNAGTLTISGIEAAGTLSPIPNLTLTGGFSYTHVKVDSITLPANLLAVLTANGSPSPSDIKIQGQPKWTVNAGVNLDYPEKVLGGDLNASLDWHYTGTTRQVELTIPSYHNVDLRVGLDSIGGTGISVAAYVKNLTDEIIYQGGGSTSRALGIGSYILGMPRTFGLQLRYTFGSN